MHRDQLGVEGLRLRCLLGTDRAQTMAAQDVLMDFTLYLDLSAAGRSDEPADSVDMPAVALSVRRYAAHTAHELLESLASEIARILLTDFPVQEARLVLRKPGAFADAESECVSLTRQRAHFKPKPG